MQGLLGIAYAGAAPAHEGELEEVAGSLWGGARPTVKARFAALLARGWARSVQGEDGVHVAGSAHLVNRAELASECGVSHPLDIVAHLYRRHGTGSIAQLNGDFCLAIVDPGAERLVLATDRFATRSLYYGGRHGHLEFSSRLGALAARLGRDIDHQAILEYLHSYVVPAPRTPFSSVRKLPAGHLLIADRSGTRVHPYWDMVYQEMGGGSAKEWARRLRAEIEQAARRFVEAEESSTEIGTFLSGGTDSSTVAGMVGAITGNPVKTFSIGYQEAGYDELSYARVASRWFGTAQHEYRLSPAEALAALPPIVHYYEEPFGNASALPTYRCAQLAREHAVSVLFAGDGGDELFAGNERYAADKLFGLYQRIPRRLRRAVTDPLFTSLPDGLPILGRAHRYVRRSNIANPRRIFSYGLLLSTPLDTMLTPEFLAAARPQEILATAVGHFNRPAPGTAELNRLLYLDLKMAIADNDIRKVSGMAELAGIQVRYPLLDTRLAEFSGRIPSRLKLRGFQKRYIFKRALADFLPPEVLKKPKHGFGAPVAAWMRDDAGWQSFVGDLLHDSRTRGRGYLRPSVFDDLWRQLRDDRQTSHHGDSLWPFLMLELWHREHVDGRA